LPPPNTSPESFSNTRRNHADGGFADPAADDEGAASVSLTAAPIVVERSFVEP
jgi:hypothetical protein